jgi:hypothetical protein
MAVTKKITIELGDSFAGSVCDDSVGFLKVR